MLAGYSQLSDYLTQTRLLIHDPNQSDYTDSGLTPIINNARLRVAQELRCVRQQIVGLNTITQQETYPLNGFVGGVVVNAGGQNYPVATGVSFTSSDGNGGGAAGQVLVSNGAIQQINMTNWGGGYTAPVVASLTGIGAGTGASISPVTGLSIHDILQITVLWGAQQSSLAPTMSWLPWGAFQAFCRAYRATFANPGAFTVHYGTTSPLSPQADARRVYMYPIPNQPYSMEWDVSVLPNLLVNAADVDYQIVSPWNDAIQYMSAHLAFLGLQQWTEAGIMQQLYEKRLVTLPATAFARRVHSFYRTFAWMAGRI